MLGIIVDNSKFVYSPTTLKSDILQKRKGTAENANIEVGKSFSNSHSDSASNIVKITSLVLNQSDP